MSSYREAVRQIATSARAQTCEKVCCTLAKLIQADHSCTIPLPLEISAKVGLMVALLILDPYIVPAHGLTIEPHTKASHPRPHTQLLPLFSLAKTSIKCVCVAQTV